jgi:hypothetical protein
MTKDHIPAGAEFGRADDEFFERSSIQALSDMTSTSDWVSAIGLWAELKKCHPATRLRILMHGLRLCSERQQPPPKILIDCLEGGLSVSAAPRARAKDPNLIPEVAHHLVRNPGASVREIAAALGRDSQKDTIHRLLSKDSAFWKECALQSALYDDERAQTILQRYVKLFGQTFEYGTDESGNAALSSLVPYMLDAIEGREPPLTTETVRKIAASQSDIRSEAALKSRLAPGACRIIKEMRDTSGTR